MKMRRKRKDMKKAKLFKLLSLLFVFGLVSCGGQNPSTSSQPSLDHLTDVDYPTTIPTMEESSVQIHYARKDNKYAPWCLWLWNMNGGAGKIYNFNYQDSFGVVASYPLSTFGANMEQGELGFIVRQKSSWTKDVDADRSIDFSTLEKDDSGIFHVYLFSGDANIYTSPEKEMVDEIQYAKFMDGKTIACETNKPIEHFQIYEDDQLIVDKDQSNLNGYYHTLDHAAYINKTYKTKVTFSETKQVLESNISITGLYRSKSFNDQYYYDGELGAIYTKTSTTFKVWSPISSKITLRIYQNGTPLRIDSALGDDTYKEYPLLLGEKGVFSTTVSGDLAGKYYTYVVYNSQNKNGKEIVDPYAKSAGVNGLRGMIVDFSKTNPEGWDEMDIHPYDRKELTVYETHVSDVTSSDTWNGSKINQKKYLGLIEEGTTYTKNGVTTATGFDHIKDLGVNAVQLLPIFDQDNDEVNVKFNWGYNPLNYNVLEGAYSSNPHDGYARIKEFKKVVKAFHDAGINIIMDVVFNHVSSMNASNFQVLMPGYYFRLDGKDLPYNGSGCGNETASENKMFQKFMIDSASFWAEEYKLGGFRFDLMGLHDIDTMNALSAKLKEINEAITVYGEPWTGGTSGLSESKQAKQNNGNQFIGFGQFNDQMRDGLIKGGLNGPTTQGWITNAKKVDASNVNQIMAGIKGITKSSTVEIADPDKTVNYVTCHDNYTLYDRIKAAKVTDEEAARKMSVLANAVVFTSQGTTFMLAGDEMLRTKGGNSNSYDASYKVNELDYSKKIDYPEVYENYKSLIAFKQEMSGLHLNKDEIGQIQVESLSGGSVIKYSLYDQENHREYVIVHANGVTGKSPIDLSSYRVYLDTLKLNEKDSELGTLTPGEYQTIIAYKNVA